MIIAILCVMLLVDVMVFASDRYLWSTFLLIGETAALYFFIPGVAAYVMLQGWMSFALHALPVYIGIGVGVAAFKWVLNNFKVARLIKEATLTFDPAERYSQYNRFEMFAKHVTSRSWWGRMPGTGHSNYSGINSTEDMTTFLVPRPSRSVDRIGSWIVQWPIVLLSFVLEDVLLKFSSFVATIFSAVFSRMSKYLIADATKGLNFDEKPVVVVVDVGVHDQWKLQGQDRV